MDNPGNAPATTTGVSAFQLPDGSKSMPLGSGEITKRLGTGGMATVYEIWNPRLEMHRAVKIINPGSAETAYTRFETEIKISAKLRHPNIVEIHGTGEWNGLPFIEMEKVEGQGLDQIIKERGGLPETACVAIGIMVGRALEYAHHRECVIFGVKYQGVIHRDLKPSNIMLTPGGTVKLMDFGIARPMDTGFQTMEGLVSGTLQYLSPEQIEKKDLDARTDIYTLGICLYEMSTGAIAFPQTSFAELVTFKTKSRFKPINEFPVRVSAQFKRVIERCMQQDPGKRFQDAAELLAELDKILRTLTNETPEAVLAGFAADSRNGRVPKAKQSRIPWKVLATVIGVVAVAVLYYTFAKRAVRPHIVPGMTVAPTSVPASAVKPASNRVASPGPADKTTLPAASAPQTPVRVIANEKKSGNRLPTVEAGPTASILFKLRSLQARGNEVALAAFLRSTDLKDGEWYLAKAKLSYNKGKYHECEISLQQSRGMPCEIMGKAALNREASYYSALCASIRFEANPNNQNYTKATGAWRRVQEMATVDGRDPYATKAKTELVRIEKLMRGKG